MSGITGGSFSFSRTVKTGDFENKKAEATISFSVDEGTDAAPYYASAITLAQNGVLSALGLPAVKEVPNFGAAAADGQKEAFASRRGGRRKPPTPDDPAGMDVVTKQPDPTSGGQDAGDASGSQAGTVTSSEASGEEDPLGFLGGSDGSDEKLDDILGSEATEVTDAELVAAITARNNATKNTQAIRKLIGNYTPQDGAKHSANEIAQDKRQGFLTELANIQAPA